VRALELAGQRLQAFERAVVVVLGPGGPEPPLDGRPVALGQVVQDVSLLVPHAALYRRLAEDRPDRLPQRLGAVDDEQDPLLGIEATLDQIREQRGRDGRVLGRAFPEPERDLGALGRDPERDDVGAALQLDPVQHQHRQPDVVEPAADQLAERRAGALHKGPRDRRLRRRLAACSRPEPPAPACAGSGASGDTGQHPLQHTAVSGSRSAKCAYVASGSSACPSALLTRGRSTETRRPPSVTSPDS